MSARLSPLQRQVLDQLAHIRVAPEDAWLTTRRLRQLTGCGTSTVDALLRRHLVSVAFQSSATDDDLELLAWRITDKGREALT